jgi:hypothetical protein
VRRVFLNCEIEQDENLNIFSALDAIDTGAII